jgi:DNA-directed RNA polymerase subunit M/transcription elongation factor TFIIS
MTDELKTYKDFFNQLKNCKTTNRSFLKDLYTLILEVDEECSKNAETLKFIIELRDFIGTVDDVIEDINYNYVGGDEDDDEDDDDYVGGDEEFENLKEEFEQLVLRITVATASVAVATVNISATTASVVANVSASTEPLKDIRSEMIDLIDDFLECSECDVQSISDCFAANLTDQLIDYYEKHEGLKKDKTLQSFLYEFLGYIHKDFYVTIDDMKNHNVVEWDASIFEKCKTFRREALSKVMFKPVAIKGLDFCYKCKGDEFTYWQAQTRGNDEQTTTFKRCIKCNF